jgi:DNA (cytosine-5)-methyltransferase 1
MLDSITNYQQLDLFEIKPSQSNREECSPSISQWNFTFVDLFAGIGGFRIPLTNLGGTCLGYSEIDRQALQVYKDNFLHDHPDRELNLGDITAIENLPFSADLVVGGVPCQPWSIAGKLKGLADPRGRLWFDVFRLVGRSQPKAFIFENVKGLLDPRNRESLRTIVDNLTEIGYSVKYQILNSADFGVPQSRQRIFLVGLRKDLRQCWNFQFPNGNNLNKNIGSILDINSEQFSELKNRLNFKEFFIFSDVRDGSTTIHSWDLIETTSRQVKICQTLLRNRRKKRYGCKDGNPLSYDMIAGLIPDIQLEELEILKDKNILRNAVLNIDHNPADGYEFVNSKISSGINGISKIYLPTAKTIGTLTATGTNDFVATVSISAKSASQYKQEFLTKIYYPRNFRSLTAIDYAKLQGFPDRFQIARQESVAKHQFGNAVSVPVIEAIAQKLLPLIL